MSKALAEPKFLKRFFQNFSLHAARSFESWHKSDGFLEKCLAMSESLTDRTEPQSRRGAGEARFGAKSLMQDKASYLALLRIRDYVVCLSKWLCDPKRAYAAHIRRLDMTE